MYERGGPGVAKKLGGTIAGINYNHQKSKDPTRMCGVLTLLHGAGH